MKTVNEIGVSFSKRSVCYLGEIIIEQKRRHLNGKSTPRILPCRLHSVLYGEVYIAGALRHDKSVSLVNEVLDRIKV